MLHLLMDSGSSQQREEQGEQTSVRILTDIKYSIDMGLKQGSNNDKS